MSSADLQILALDQATGGLIDSCPDHRETFVVSNEYPTSMDEEKEREGERERRMELGAGRGGL